MRERTQLDDAINGYKKLAQELDDNIELIELGEAEGDDDTVAEAEDGLRSIHKIAAQRELESLLSGEADSNDAYLEIHAGAGGTEAQDWASMMARMYYRWAESKKYKLEMLEESDGEEAGIKSVTYKVSGHNAYGWLKNEVGVHRLVRISHVAIQAFHRSGCIRGLMTIFRSKFSIRIFALIPIVHPGPVVSTLTGPILRYV